MALSSVWVENSIGNCCSHCPNLSQQLTAALMPAAVQIVYPHTSCENDCVSVVIRRVGFSWLVLGRPRLLLESGGISADLPSGGDNGFDGGRRGEDNGRRLATGNLELVAQ